VQQDTNIQRNLIQKNAFYRFLRLAGTVALDETTPTPSTPTISRLSDDVDDVDDKIDEVDELVAVVIAVVVIIVNGNCVVVVFGRIVRWPDGDDCKLVEGDDDDNDDDADDNDLVSLFFLSPPSNFSISASHCTFNAAIRLSRSSTVRENFMANLLDFTSPASRTLPVLPLPLLLLTLAGGDGDRRPLPLDNEED
jgi:hypothetical protein